MILIPHFPIRTVIMTMKVIPKGKENDGGEGKSDRPKAHWSSANKKVFLDLTLEE